MTWVIAVTAVLLGGVAAAGVLRPFGRARVVAPEGRADPLEDERGSLLRALRELDRDRAAGLLSEEDYRALREETEARAVTVLRALEAREGAAEMALGLRELRIRRAGGDGEARRGRSTLLSGLVVGAAILAVSVPLLFASVGTRSAGQPFTGDIGSAADSLDFFERRVREHPRDLAARLDLAQRYLELGRVGDATEQYLAVLDLAPRNAEANAKLAFLLYLGGATEEALQTVNRALEVDPDYPEALYIKGVILLRGLNRPDQAEQALRAYLEAAPFGAYRTEAEELLREADRAASRAP